LISANLLLSVHSGTSQRLTETVVRLSFQSFHFTQFVVAAAVV